MDGRNGTRRRGWTRAAVVAALSAGVLGTLLSGAPVTSGATGPVRLAATPESREGS